MRRNCEQETESFDTRRKFQPGCSRIKKWWWPFYSWFLSVCAVHAWRLRVIRTGKKEAFLPFLRELVLEMMGRHGHLPYNRGIRHVPVAKLRYDNVGHMIVPLNGGRSNCKHCHEQGKKDSKSLFKCEKCSVGLHVQCFKGKD